MKPSLGFAGVGGNGVGQPSAGAHNTTMRSLPYDSMIVECPDRLGTVVAKLRAQVEPRKWFRFTYRHLPFEGDVDEAGFRINRIIHYRNSFLPIIDGRFEPHNSGTLVHVRMTLHPLVAGFMCIWFGMAALFSIVGLFVFIGGGDGMIALISCGMALFSAALTLGGFLPEAAKAKRLLRNTILLGS